MAEERVQPSRSEFVTVYYVAHHWTAPDNPELQRWKLIIGRGNTLEWVYTYNPTLTQFGTQSVEFYKDTSMRPCIRKPKDKKHGQI